MTKIITSLFISIFSLINITFAQEEVDNSESTKEIVKVVSQLDKLSPENYMNKIDDIRERLEKYFDNKKRVCEGDFSTVVLTKGKRNNKNDSVKLSKEEREVCFRELKRVQQKYIESLFGAKKKYIVHLHELRLKEFEKSKDRAIKNLSKKFNKKGRR